MTSVSIFVSLIFFHLVFPSAQHANTDKEKCPASFDCGYIGTIKFPFTTAERQDCGLFPIQGCKKHVPELSKTIKLVQNLSFVVVKVLGPSAIILEDSSLRKLLQTRKCSAFSKNFTLPPNSPLASFNVSPRVIFFRCNRSLNINPPSRSFLKYACPNDNLDIFYSISPPNHSYGSLSACSAVELPNRGLPNKDLFTFVSSEVSLGVQLSEDCIRCHYKMGGQCQLDNDKEFRCVKEDNTNPIIKLKLALGLGLGGLLVAIAGGLVIRVYAVKLKKKNSTNQMIESLLQNHGSLQIRRYTFSEIKKVTKNFANKLGQGGYGSVYKGQLLDGRPVAVKILAESKGNGEEFINEVASISNTSHVNIVTLLGFCIEGSNKALIYEFMSNGSLEKFLQEGNAKMLDCQTLYDIAIGVARGLEYLHRGCNTKILHFDIKPHNILLDEHFCPKISDFGLAKVCPERESKISLNCARGTIGYIAPEVFSRNFGVVSHKSDVFSYGMMVIEMIGREKKINVEINHPNEFYLPHWIYKSLESGQELELQCIRNDIDKERLRKMMVVGLWCIQTDPTDRPTITKVVQMLEGSLECLQIPPKPYHFSPSTSPTHYSGTCTS